MSLLIDPEGQMMASKGSAEPSAFHRVSSKPSGVSSSNNHNNNCDDSPIEEDEVDSPTPSSTASESGMSPKSRPKNRQTGEDESGGHDAFAWPSHSTYDEQRQLLGTEEESSDRSEDEMSEDSDKRSVWMITKEQLNYYTTQFFNMQPNPSGIIPGTLAKEFFERSRLPISELRTIWQLSDVGKDGGLSLEEFLTAMHLVVLRRNDIQLPETLPSCLNPLHLKRKLLGLKQQDANAKGEVSDETTSLASLVSSPGREKPVNFDFSRSDVRRDPHIVQPVALRLSDSPVDGATCQSSDLDETEDEAKRAELLRRPSGQKQPKGEVHYEQLWNAARDDDDDDDDSIDGDHSTFHQRGKQQSLDYGGPASLPPSHFNKTKPHPPPPPPRTGYKTSHARSSSLDLNRSLPTQPPPAVPPRLQNESPAEESNQSPSPRASTGHAAIAFHRQSRSDYKQGTEHLSKDIKSLQISIHEYKERNSVVARTINELHQEVSDTLEERIALEYQLEQLKSFGE